MTHSSSASCPSSACRPIPLTFVLEELNFGGTQKQTLELARHVDRSLFAPRIWTLWNGKAMLPMAQESDIPVTALLPDARLHPARAAVALWRQLRRERPPLIHLCTAFPNVWGRILGRLAGVPAIVASCRGQGNVKGQHEWALGRLAHVHVCNARSIEKALLERGLRHVHYIPNGVDTAFFTPAPAFCREPEMLCVGRLVPDKDHKTLLEAFALVRAQLPAARLHLVGDGPLHEELHRHALGLGLGEAVLFHGSRDNVRDYLHKARLMVLASVSEGMPNVLLEGMACGLPVAATRVGGIPDLVEHGVHGLLAPPRDPAALAQCLLPLLTDDALARNMGEAGRALAVQHYSLEALARTHQQIYGLLCRRVGLSL